MKFQVITKVPNEEEAAQGGNLAAVLDLWQVDPAGQYGIECTRVDPMATLLTLRAPVFYIGEILIIDGDGREVAGLGRKASKWTVSTEEFDDLDAAVARARQAMSDRVTT